MRKETGSWPMGSLARRDQEGPGRSVGARAVGRGQIGVGAGPTRRGAGRHGIADPVGVPLHIFLSRPLCGHHSPPCRV